MKLGFYRNRFLIRGSLEIAPTRSSGTSHDRLPSSVALLRGVRACVFVDTHTHRRRFFGPSGDYLRRVLSRRPEDSEISYSCRKLIRLCLRAASVFDSPGTFTASLAF